MFNIHIHLANEKRNKGTQFACGNAERKKYTALYSLVRPGKNSQRIANAVVRERNASQIIAGTG